MTAYRRKTKRFWFLLLLLVVVAGVLTSKSFWRIIYPLPYRDVIFTEASRNRVDPFLVAAIIKSESNFNPQARSAMGARGIMQIMPDTGAWAANRMKLKDYSPDDLYDPEISIKIGCWYLKDLNSEFEGNKILVVAAYNGGRGNVKQWVEKEQWTGEHATVDQIPFPETRAYVSRVLKSYSWYRYLYK